MMAAAFLTIKASEADEAAELWQSREIRFRDMGGGDFSFDTEAQRDSAAAILAGVFPKVTTWHLPPEPVGGFPKTIPIDHVLVHASPDAIAKGDPPDAACHFQISPAFEHCGCEWGSARFSEHFRQRSERWRFTVRETADGWRVFDRNTNAALEILTGTGRAQAVREAIKLNGHSNPDGYIEDNTPEKCVGTKAGDCPDGATALPRRGSGAGYTESGTRHHGQRCLACSTAVAHGQGRTEPLVKTVGPPTATQRFFRGLFGVRLSDEEVAALALARARKAEQKAATHA
jgi:hypothetical protein